MQQIQSIQLVATACLRPSAARWHVALAGVLAATVCLATGASAALPVETAADVASAPAADTDQPDESEPASRWAVPRYPGARVFIDAQGAIFVDDEPATPALLHEAFSNLSRYNGVVWYYREHPSREPEGVVAAAVDEVIGILTGYKLAVELFEAGFPDPEAHRQSLENPPLRQNAGSPTADAEQAER